MLPTVTTSRLQTHTHTHTHTHFVNFDKLDCVAGSELRSGGFYLLEQTCAHDSRRAPSSMSESAFNGSERESALSAPSTPSSGRRIPQEKTPHVQTPAAGLYLPARPTRENFASPTFSIFPPKFSFFFFFFSATVLFSQHCQVKRGNETLPLPHFKINPLLRVTLMSLSEDVVVL